MAGKVISLERVLVVLLVCLLTIYAPLELTRMIVLEVFILRLHPSIPNWNFLVELGFLWIFYIAGMVVVYKRTKCQP